MTKIQALPCTPEILKSAQKTTSKNGILKELYAHLVRYNGFLPNLVKFKEKDQNFLPPAYMVETLDKLCLSCMAYLLYRAPQVRKESGKKKWSDVLKIQKTLMEHADSFGIRLLRGQFSSNLDSNYWLERAFPASEDSDEYGSKLIARAGTGQIESYKEWTYDKLNDTKTSFVDWLKDRGEEGSKHLKYFNDLTRQQLEVECVNSRLKIHAQDVNECLDTTHAQGAAYSGLMRVYIYVCSAISNKIYTAEGVEGEIHHSSFLCGEPVIAAGDWLVVNGEVKYVNAESGHYRPTLDNMRLFANKFKHFWNPETLIQAEHRGKIMKMNDFIAFGKGVLAAPPAMIQKLESYVGPNRLKQKKK